MTFRSRVPSLLLVALHCLGCDAKDFNDYAEQNLHYPAPPDAGVTVDELESPADGGADSLCAPLSPCTPDDPPGTLCNTAQTTETGTVTGVVVVPEGTRAGGTHALAGTLMVVAASSSESESICPTEPAAPPAAFAGLACGDLSGGVEVPFALHGVPVSSEPWSILLFLDVNGNYALDACDLVALPGSAAVTEPGVVALDEPIRLEVRAVLLVPVCGFPACE